MAGYRKGTSVAHRSSIWGTNTGPYDFIMADPPWRFKTYSLKGKLKKAPELHYETMTIAEISVLPVHELAAPNCALWLWTTGAFLASGDTHKVLNAWGFKPKTVGVWAKRTKHGLWHFGTGYRLRESAEYLVVATRGSPKNTRSTRSLIEGTVREHSRKPEEAFQAAELWMPNARRIELFSRTVRPGWDVWGKEVNKFTFKELRAGYDAAQTVGSSHRRSDDRVDQRLRRQV